MVRPVNVIDAKTAQDVRKRSELEYFDKINKRSVVNLVNPKLSETIEMSRKHIEHLLLLDEVEFKKTHKPTPTLNRLRISFWKEYDSTQARMRKSMDMGNVYGGIVSKQMFQKICEVHTNLAWILKPPVDYILATEEALLSGIDRLREILELPLTKIESVKVGKDEFEDRVVVDTKAAELLLKVTMMLDLRVKGSVAQKVETKNLTAQVTYEGDSSDVQKVAQAAMPELSSTEVDKKISEMEKRLLSDLQKAHKPLTKKELAGTNVNPLDIETPEYEVKTMDVPVMEYKKPYMPQATTHTINHIDGDAEEL